MEEAGIEYVLYDTLHEAVYESLNQVEENDLILLAGSQGMDFGGKYILHELLKRNPRLDEEQTLSPLENRIAGIHEINE